MLKTRLDWLISHRFTLIMLMLGLVYLGKVIQFFIWNPNFFQYWDWPGHIDKAQKLSWLPWQSGWDTTFWGGYSTLTYPIISHYLLKIFLAFGPYTPMIIAYTVLLMAINLFAFARLSRHFTTSKKLACLIFALLLLISLNAEARYLGSFLGTLSTGSISANLGLSLLIFLFTSTNVYFQAFFSGLLLLTHSLTAVIGILFLLPTLINQIQYSRVTLVNAFIILFMVMGMASPWLIPYLDPAFKGAAESMSGGQLVVPVFLLGLQYLKIRSTKQAHPLDIVLIGLALFTIIPEKLAFNLKRIGLSGLHFYRYYFLLLNIAASYLFAFFFPKKYLKDTLSFVILIGSFVFLMSNQWVSESDVTFNFDDEAIHQLKGRVINVSSMEAIPNHPHLIETYFTSHNPQLVGSEGLFYESSQRGLQYYSLANSLQPNTFKNGTFGIFFNNADGKPWLNLDPFETANLLGVTSIVYVDKPTEKREFGTVVGTVQRNHQLKYQIVAEIFPQSRLVESLDFIPPVDPKVNLGNWWLDTTHKDLIIKTPLPSNRSPLNIKRPTVSITSTTPQTIELNIESIQPAPLIVKFSYNKYWQSAPLNTQSYTSVPLWITPGHLFLIANGQVKLTWKPPYYLIWTYFLFFVSGGYLLAQSIKLSNQKRGV